MAEVMLGRVVARHSPARLSARKAGIMLTEGTVRGHPLTTKQTRFFQAVKHGWTPTRKG